MTVGPIVRQKYMKLFRTPASVHIFCRNVIPEQRGFVNGRPAQTSLRSFPSQVAPPVHGRGLADVVCFDVSKALDEVNH